MYNFGPPGRCLVANYVQKRGAPQIEASKFPPIPNYDILQTFVSKPRFLPHFPYSCPPPVLDNTTLKLIDIHARFIEGRAYSFTFWPLFPFLCPPRALTKIQSLPPPWRLTFKNYESPLRNPHSWKCVSVGIMSTSSRKERRST